MSDDFTTPTGLIKDHVNSSKTVISMRWSAITPGTAPGGDILGYLLRVEDTNTGTTWIAFNGTDLSLPTQLRATVPGLVTGRDYKFSVAAQSFNGIGAWSDPVTYFACVPPSKLEAPKRVTTTISSITIEWNHPKAGMDGGCPIQSYAVWCDDGLGGAFSEVNSDNDLLVRNKPGLNTLVITSPFTAGNLEGREYRIYVTAFNRDGSTDSDIATITLGDVPLAPPTAPFKLQSMSSTSTIAVQIDAIPASEQEGLTVVSYCLEIDDNLDNVFREVNGCITTSMALTHIVRGLELGSIHAFRYKARNAYGWSPYSQTAYLKVATEPGKPMTKPNFISSSETAMQITLDLQSVRANGETITLFGLEIDGGSGFVPVVGFDGLSSAVTINAVDESLTAGSVYTLRYRAQNVIGWGPYSDTMTAALVSLPS